MQKPNFILLQTSTISNNVKRTTLIVHPETQKMMHFRKTSTYFDTHDPNNHNSNIEASTYTREAKEFSGLTFDELKEFFNQIEVQFEDKSKRNFDFAKDGLHTGKKKLILMKSGAEGEVLKNFMYELSDECKPDFNSNMVGQSFVMGKESSTDNLKPYQMASFAARALTGQKTAKLKTNYEIIVIKSATVPEEEFEFVDDSRLPG